MARISGGRNLIVNADDFGKSPGNNQAVREAHRDGILTSASLMVNEEGFEEAVDIARRCPRLGTGLHLSLTCGRASRSSTKHAAPASSIGSLTNEYQAGQPKRLDKAQDWPTSKPVGNRLADALGNLDSNPVRAGIRYFFNRALRSQLRSEIDSQLERFMATGLNLDHLNGHLNIHLHPTVFEILLDAFRPEMRMGFRLTHDRFRLNARIARGNWGYRISHAIVFGLLSARARPRVQRTAWRSTDSVFGLLQNARVDEDYIVDLLPRLPRGHSELYSHPFVPKPRHEFDALVSPRVRKMIDAENIRLIRYQDL